MRVARCTCSSESGLSSRPVPEFTPGPAAAVSGKFAVRRHDTGTGWGRGCGRTDDVRQRLAQPWGQSDESSISSPQITGNVISLIGTVLMALSLLFIGALLVMQAMGFEGGGPTSASSRSSCLPMDSRGNLHRAAGHLAAEAPGRQGRREGQARRPPAGH